MANDERNFRSSYYEKVGCHSVEEKKSLNKLLQDQIRNHSKLKQFCLSYTVPKTHRSLLWNIILGVMPLHKNSTEYVMEQRKAVFEDLQRAVTVMQCLQNNTSKCHLMLCMWQLEQNHPLSSSLGASVSYSSSIDSADMADSAQPISGDSIISSLETNCNNFDLKYDYERNFIAIVRVLLQIFEEEVDDIEIYWLAKEFYATTREIQKERIKLKELTANILRRDDLILYKHLCNLDVFTSNDVLEKWYTTCFAGVLSESSLVRVWDKVCGGSRKIVVFVFLELAKAMKENVLKCKSRFEFKELIEQVKDQDAVIVNKAIKSWQNNKQHNEITAY